MENNAIRTNLENFKVILVQILYKEVLSERLVIHSMWLNSFMSILLA